MGYFLLPLTLSADILGGYLSYYYGASFLPWFFLLVSEFLWPAFLWLISRPVWFMVSLSLPALPPSFIPFFQQPVWPTIGMVWVGFFLATHGISAIKHLIWRYDNTYWGALQPGNPGEQKWELIQRRWRDYDEASKRFYQQIEIQFPLVRYTIERSAPRVEWRGRLLLIREDELHPEQVEDLAPELAYQLAIINSHDWLFRDLLDYYPKRATLFHALTGIGIWLPSLVKECLWPLLHWRKRVFVADKLTWVLGQGQAQYNRLARLPSREQRTFFSPFPLLSERKGRLEVLLRAEHEWMKKQQLVPEDSEPALLAPPSLIEQKPLPLPPAKTDVKYRWW